MYSGYRGKERHDPVEEDPKNRKKQGHKNESQA